MNHPTANLKLKDTTMNTCTTCGQLINEVVTIAGLPYGTTCAEKILGVERLPSWFKGGDWDKAQQDHKQTLANNIESLNDQKSITSQAWEEWMALSIAYKREYANGNQWASDFLISVIHQLGYFTYIANTKWVTMEDAEINWAACDGSFPYLNKQPRKIDSLSEKQRSIISKFI